MSCSATRRSDTGASPWSCSAASATRIQPRASRSDVVGWLWASGVAGWSVATVVGSVVGSVATRPPVVPGVTATGVVVSGLAGPGARAPGAARAAGGLA
jgi:hypothetical protein